MIQRFAILLVLGLAVLVGGVSCSSVDDGPGAGVVRRREASADPKGRTARDQAKEDFGASVRTWGRVLTGILVVVGVAALVLSFLPAGHALGLSTSEAVLVLALSGGTPVLQYLLQAWGVLAADLAAWMLLAGVVVSMLTLGAMLVRRGVSTAAKLKLPQLSRVLKRGARA